MGTWTVVGERFALLRYCCDTPGCGWPHQCPVLRHPRLLLQTLSLPCQGLKAAAVVGQKQGGRGQVLVILGVGEISSGEQKRTHPKEAVSSC